MRRLNVPLVADTLLVAVCAFLLFFTAVRYYTKNAVFGLVFAVFAFFTFGALAFYAIGRKQDRKLLLARDEKQKGLLSLHLSLCTQTEILSLFSSALENAVREGATLTDGSRRYYFSFRLRPLTPDDVAEVVKSDSGQQEKVVYCNQAGAEARQLAADFNISLKCANDAYALLKQQRLLPEKYKFEEKQRLTFFGRIRARFTRRQSVRLFRCGAALILFSFFTFFPVYYIVSGGALFVLAAVCLIFGKRE